MTRQVFSTDSAPGAMGPYSQAVIANGFIFTAGQGGVDPVTGAVVEGGIQAQTRQTLENIKAILEGAGSSMADVVKATVFLKDMGDFGAMNEIYAEFFPENPPARSAVEMARLPFDILVEIEVVAVI